MRFYLYRVGVVHQTQALFYHLHCEKLSQSCLRVRGQVGVVVADCAIHLAQNFNLCDAFLRALQAGNDVGHFLAQRGRARSLAVGARQHRYVGIRMRELGQAW